MRCSHACSSLPSLWAQEAHKRRSATGKLSYTRSCSRRPRRCEFQGHLRSQLCKHADTGTIIHTWLCWETVETLARAHGRGEGGKHGLQL